jgi:MFS family permease
VREDLFVRTNLRWNAVVLSLDYGLFGLGLTFVSTSTILPAFAERLGAPNVVIGALPALLSAGWSFPGLFTANYIERLSRKLPLILAVTTGERLPFLVLAVVSCLFAASYPSAVLVLTLFLIAIMAFAGGAIMPAWMDLIAKLIPTTNRGRFFALGSTLGGLWGVGGTFLAGYFLRGYPYPLNYGLCFAAGFVALAASFVFLALAREHAVGSGKPAVGLGRYLRRLPFVLRGNSNFRWYLVGRSVGTLGTMAVTFYTVYALKELRVDEGQVAAFTFFVLAAQTVSNVVLGWLADRLGHKLVLLLGSIALAVGSLLAVAANSLPGLYGVFAMVGISASAFGISGLNILLEFCEPQDRPTYLGLGGALLAPFSFAAPMLGGWLADQAGFLAVFWASAALSGTSALLLSLLVREPRRAAPPVIRL